MSKYFQMWLKRTAQDVERENGKEHKKTRLLLFIADNKKWE